MFNGKKHWGLLLLLILTLTVTVTLPAYAVITEEIEEKQEEMEEVEDQQRREESNLEQRLNREAALKDELERLENRLEELRAEQEQLRREIEELEEEISQVESELADAEAKHREQKDLLNQRLRAIQRYGWVSYVEVLFESSNFNDFLTRLYNLSKITSNDISLIEDIQEEKDIIQDWKDELEQNKKELEEMHNQVASNEQEMEQAKERRETVLAQLQKDIEKNLKAIEDLEEESQRLDSLIRELIAEAESRFGGIDGELKWPIEPPTWISSGYGYRNDPFSGNRAWHGGVDMAPHGGEANYILATAEGEVILSGWNGGYGNCIMIDHGAGTVTLYAHMSSLHVDKGEIVSRGDRIGRAGTTGYSTGVHLHFEVREYEKDPVRSYPSGSPDHRYNPMEYFGNIGS
ncbi:MAG: peptidoglycan DD-metalloendopeptidase family protein [Bacillota bacterium]